MTRDAASSQSPALRPVPGRVASALSALALLALSACATQGVRPQGSLENVRGGARFAVGSVAADLTVVGDSRQILHEALDDALAEASIACPAPNAASCYTIDAKASLRDPAPAFAGSGSGPRLRVAELSASLREPGSTFAAAPIRVEHTIAASGNLSTATWMRVSDGLAVELASALAARGSKDAVSVRLPAWASYEQPLSRVSNVQSFQVAVVGDSRGDRQSIGSVDVGRGQSRPVRLARPPTDYLTEAITDELRAAGHIIVPAPDGRFVGSELSEFWVQATPGFGGWTVQARITLNLEVAPPPGLKRRKASPHSCERSEKVAAMPGDTALTRVLELCIGDLMASIRSDAAWSQ